MNLLIFPVSGRVPARQPADTGFTGSLTSLDSLGACRHWIHREPAGTGFTGEPAGTGFDSSSKGKDKTVTGYDVKGIS
jgi:hypothetical protein